MDLLGLMGDAVDNIKGVPGIGEKGARELIGTYGSLDALLAAAAKLPQKRYREALLAHGQDAIRSRELAQIRTDVPLDVELDALQYRGADRDACYQLFVELGFRSFTNEFAPTAAVSRSTYTLIESIDELTAVVAEARSAGHLGMRTIGDDPSPMRARLVGIALSPAPLRAYYVPVGHRTLDGSSNLDAAAVLKTLAPVLGDEAVEKTGHDLKSDLVILARHGVAVRGPLFDSMIASYLIDVSRAPHALEAIASEHLGYRAATDQDVFGRGGKASGPAEVPSSALLTFAAERADLPLRLADLLRAKLREKGLSELYQQMEAPLIPVLADIEQAGVRIDVEALGALSKRLDQEMAARSARIYELGGGEFNINSPKQLSEVLFEKLKLPSGRKTGKTRVASTSVDVLEDLASVHELPRLILEWRGMQKLKGTYVDALPQLVLPGHRARAHQLQPGGGGDRPPEQQRSESAEHPDSDRAGARDPPGVRRLARARPDLGRLLADRAARARASVRRCDADRRVPPEGGHSRPDRAQDLRGRRVASTATNCAAARRWSTTRSCTARPRSRCRATSA